MTPDKIPPKARPLGELLASYRGSLLNRILAVLTSLFFLLMMAGGTIVLFKFGFPGRTTTPAEVADKEAFTNVLKAIMSLLTLAAAGFWGWCIWRAMKYSDTKLLILREGLAFVQGGKVRTCRWNDITKVVYHGPFPGIALVMEGTTHAAYRLKLKGRNRLPALVQRWPSTRVTTCGGWQKGPPRARHSWTAAMCHVPAAPRPTLTPGGHP